MTLEIHINGRRRSVVVEKIASSGSEFLVTVDGRSYRVDAIPVRACLAEAPGPKAFSILLLEERRRGSHAATVLNGSSSNELDIQLRGASFRADLNGRRPGRQTDAGGIALAGALPILAPMPGKVIRVLVEAGDDVTAGQGLVIVEAMKMENELRAPKAGRVKEIAARDGMPVEAGRVLVVIE